jgi:hypothetical protein
VRETDLTAILRAPSFRRFHLVMSSGRAYEIRYPEMVQVSRTVLHINGGAVGDYDPPLFEVVSLVLIERLEILAR